MNTSLEERVTLVKRTRASAATALVKVLESGVQGASEKEICDSWLRNMERDSRISNEGWYQPPPGGLNVLIGQPGTSYERLNYESLRREDVWSREDIWLRDDSLVYVYASPFDRASGMIGDIGLTLYRGHEKAIWDHLAVCLDVTARVAHYAEVGMELRELFHYAVKEIAKANLRNETSSTGTGVSNIGHTVPWSYEAYPPDVKQVLASGPEAEVGHAISVRRVSINDSASLKIGPNMAFTIEPQVASSQGPLCSYHLIVCFSGGERTVISNFEPIFNAFGMRANGKIASLLS